MIYYGHELYHHGIAGQKWGVRNGPPYPLKSSDHSSAEKRKSGSWKTSAKTTLKSKVTETIKNSGKGNVSSKSTGVKSLSGSLGSSTNTSSNALTEKEKARAAKKDAKWIKKNESKIVAKATKKSAKELKQYQQEILNDPNSFNKNGKLSAKAVNAYNQKMAALMTEKVSNIKAPSGDAVVFVAKRGEIGVMTALASQGYNMDQFKNGVWTNGKVAYKKKVLDKM